MNETTPESALPQSPMTDPRDVELAELRARLASLRAAGTQHPGQSTGSENARAQPPAWDRLLATLGHELRNPLTPIANLIALLQMRRDLPPDTQPIIQMMDRNLWLAVRLVNDLLDTARIARGPLPIHAQPVGLHPLLREVTQMFNDSLRNRGITLTLTLDDPPGPTVAADPDRLLRAFWHLIDNAGRFTPAGGRVDVTVASPSPHTVDIQLIDTGIGIDPARIQSLSEPFDPLDDRREGDARGLGLGLPLARGIIEAHGGRVELHSGGLRQGTRVTVTLPQTR